MLGREELRRMVNEDLAYNGFVYPIKWYEVFKIFGEQVDKQAQVFEAWAGGVEYLAGLQPGRLRATRRGRSVGRMFDWLIRMVQRADIEAVLEAYGKPKTAFPAEITDIRSDRMGGWWFGDPPHLAVPSMMDVMAAYHVRSTSEGMYIQEAIAWALDEAEMSRLDHVGASMRSLATMGLRYDARLWEEYLVVIFMAEPADQRLAFLQDLYNRLAARIQQSPDGYTEFLSQDATVLDVWWSVVRAATRILFIRTIYDSWDLTHTKRQAYPAARARGWKYGRWHEIIWKLPLFCQVPTNPVEFAELFRDGRKSEVEFSVMEDAYIQHLARIGRLCHGTEHRNLGGTREGLHRWPAKWCEDWGFGVPPVLQEFASYFISG
jgi:hypothetical protein